ncbi:MAG: FAD-dependent oxidoreductase [Candidatus Eremiobacteraeota bacterium]|nr:FAD-dependent oxidoreductase [Candidatus Eremiobacteraeota bacterium]NNM92721.1 FAD-dependent oxidoreductase [Candidatus Eremiobacteraeota bacterium]
MSGRSHYDLVVIGAGSGGYAAARTARDLGASVGIVDRGPLGGLCILRGCMPSKALLASSDRVQAIRTAVALGITTGEPRVDMPYIAARKRALVGEFAADRIDGIERFPLHRGQAHFLSERELAVGDEILEADSFVIATGSNVAPHPLPGLVETGFLDSDALLDLERIPESAIVLGGGYVGCELGQFLSRMGAHTQIVIRGEHLLSGADTDIGETLTEAFRNEGIAVHVRSRMQSVRKERGRKIVRLERDGIGLDVDAEEIFYCLGRVPNIAGLGLDRAGVSAHSVTGIEIDASMRTTNPRIFAVGDVTGEFLLVHIAIYQGEIAARNALSGGDERADYRLQRSHTIFTEPQIAVAGASEKELQRAGRPYVSGSYAFAEHGKAMCLGKTDGFVKMLADPSDGRILGAACIGPEASELIHEIIVAMHFNATAEQFAKIPHLHPTLAEIWTYPAEECAEKVGASAVGARR